MATNQKMKLYGKSIIADADLNVVLPLSQNVTPKPDEVGSDFRYTRPENEWLLTTSRQKGSSSHRNEMNPKVLQVHNYMVEGRLIKNVWYYIHKQDASSFWQLIP
jgi:hypothetical protein